MNTGARTVRHPARALAIVLLGALLVLGACSNRGDATVRALIARTVAMSNILSAHADAPRTALAKLSAYRHAHLAELTRLKREAGRLLAHGRRGVDADLLARWRQAATRLNERLAATLAHARGARPTPVSRLPHGPRTLSDHDRRAPNAL